MKVGDVLILKCNTKYKFTAGGIFKRDEIYKIKSITHTEIFSADVFSQKADIINYCINGSYYSEDFVYNHFYTLKESRKIKLEKICKSDNI